jgi:hypothetical protein
MITKICPICNKELIAFTEKGVNQQMKMHTIFKHPKELL